MACRRTRVRPKSIQSETVRVGVATIVADDSLVIDSVSRERLYELPAAIVTFLERSSRRGYCPPIPILRKLGFRTRREVEAQRLACWRW
jgi:hypothetical protein